MKNKVDINKLIKEKYKSNILELSDILDEIDLVLQEAADYKTKIANPSDSIPESQESQNISYRMYGPQGTRNPKAPEPGYTNEAEMRQPSQVIPDKIAEAGSSGPPTIQGTFEMPVIDLFSMITNSKMELDDSDRELINDIVANIGASQSNSWKDRIKLIQRYTTALGQAQTVDKMNIREAISNLMFLNLFKKLSYFTDQPSKQFEYVMAPIISPTAYVIEGDKDIADVRTTAGENFSIKFLMAAAPEVKGSISRLEKHKNGLNYVFGKVFSGGMLEFGECMITAYIDSINFQEYKRVNTLQKGTVEIYEALGNITPKIKIYIRRFNDEEETVKYNIASRKFAIGEKPRTSKPTEFTATSATDLRRDLKSLITISDTIKPYYNNFKDNKPLNDRQFKTLLQQAEKYAQVNSEFAKELEKFNKIPDKERSLEAQKQFHKFFDNVLSSHVKQLSDSAKQLKEAKEAKEEPQFNINCSLGLWDLMFVDSLNLGSPSIYNNQLLFFSDTISKAFKSVMENFQQLNKNLISYFGTSVQRQKEKNEGKSSAQDCVNNAEQIIYGVTDIAGSEGEKVNVTNPRLTRGTKE